MQIPSFYYKEQSPRKKFGKQFSKYFLRPKNVQNCFWPGQRQNNLFFLCFSSVLPFKNYRKHFPLACFKNVQNYFFAITSYRVNVKILWGLEKATSKREIWNWDPKTIWHNMVSVQFFCSKITPLYCTSA